MIIGNFVTDSRCAAERFITVNAVLSVAEYRNVKAAVRRDSVRPSISSSVSQSRFFCLPPEVRHRIYLLSVTGTEPVYLQNPLLKDVPCSGDPEFEEHLDGSQTETSEIVVERSLPYFALLASCRQIYLEAQSVYYGSNTFEGSRCEVMRFGLDIGFKCRSQIRHLRLLGPVYQPNFLGAALQFPNLKSLEIVDICYWLETLYPNTKHILHPYTCYCRWYTRWSPEIKISRNQDSMIHLPESLFPFRRPLIPNLVDLDGFDSKIRECLNIFDPNAESVAANERNTPIPPEEYPSYFRPIFGF